ncbi:MAG: cation:proton antiporter, partial [Lentisphaeria bacterium]|nr:cation:proton antiporter [Lentisphaeria bacterium]
FMIIAIGFHHFEELKLIPVASLLGIMTIGFVILELAPKVAGDLAARFNKIWVLAEVLLFTMIGAVVKLDAIKGDFLILLLIIIVGLIGRSLGVWIALFGSELNNKEKTFCTIAYWPKATVQAAIGGVPLALGLPHGEEILAIAVLAIIFTAPLGAIGVRLSSEKLLDKSPTSD